VTRPADRRAEQPLPAFLHLAGAVEAPSRFAAGPALWVDGTEVLHRDGQTTYDIRLTRQIIRELRPRLVAADAVTLRRSPSADWLEVSCTSHKERALVLELAQLAVDAHRDRRPPTSAVRRSRRG
jgi:hypothetical protein